MNQIDWYLGDILEPDEKMEMQCAPVLELEPVEVALHIWGCGPCLVPKEMVLPAVNVGTTQVSLHNLLQGVGEFEYFKRCQFGGALPVPSLNSSSQHAKRNVFSYGLMVINNVG